MDDILAKLSALDQSLSEAEWRVANFIKKNAEKVPHLSVNELADASDVSVASVSRLARRIGCKSLREMKIRIAKETTHHSLENIYQGLSPKDTDTEIVQKVFGGISKSIKNTFKMLSIPDLSKVAMALDQADTVLFIGIGGSGHIAMEAALRFSHIGIHTNAFMDDYQIISGIHALKTNDVVIGISHSGRSRIVMRALELARENKATTVGISNYLKSPLHKISDIFFCTSFPEDRVNVVGLSYHISQMSLIDVLYVLTARHRPKINHASTTDELVEEILRIPMRRNH